MVGLDIFTGKKYQDISPSSHNMVKPVVSVSSYEIIDISDDGYAVLMDDDGDTREDIMAPDESSPDPALGEAIRKALDDGKGCSVTVTEAMEQEAITGYKVMND